VTGRGTTPLKETTHVYHIFMPQAAMMRAVSWGMVVFVKEKIR